MVEHECRATVIRALRYGYRDATLLMREKRATDLFWHSCRMLVAQDVAVMQLAANRHEHTKPLAETHPGFTTELPHITKKLQRRLWDYVQEG